MDTEYTEEVFELSRFKRLICRILVAAMRVWMRTLKIEIDPESSKAMTYTDEAVCLVAWHNTLLVSMEMIRRIRTKRKTSALVSASKDGAYMAYALSCLNIGRIRGSSSRFGREALNVWINKLKADEDVAITPDGPRGPVYELKPSLELVMRKTGVKCIVLGSTCHNAWEIRTWDAFRIPKPFSRITLRIELFDPSTVDRKEIGKKLHSRLMALSNLSETGSA
ncbi:MAG: DUF374 domain-containing protein [Opitutaceae bacterium]|nr:DUF374 domain-containing protein [Opitutaceae bacterium]